MNHARVEHKLYRIMKNLLGMNTPLRLAAVQPTMTREIAMQHLMAAIKKCRDGEGLFAVPVLTIDGIAEAWSTFGHDPAEFAHLTPRCACIMLRLSMRFLDSEWTAMVAALGDLAFVEELVMRGNGHDL